MLFDLTGKVFLVTGASRGIGRATAELLAEQGAHVGVHFGSNGAQAEDVVKGIVDRGGKAEAIGFDVTNSSAVDAAISDFAKRNGRLDGLVANAGMAENGLLVTMKDDLLDRVLAVNLRGALACARASIKVMMRAKRGRVVFVSSVVGEMGNAGQTAYAASKAALLGVTKSLAREYASRNITVNAITPGLVDTDMTRELTDEQRAAMVGNTPLGRGAAPREIGAPIAFLLSDEASYVTGAVLRVNGGMLM